ncbi:hypothetical protein CI610_01748 [invertebrate metagenome]|uniref:Uncharacterized protein n=1 Tax=invertebrate metagenome TaxID=1711999 RepID=A0A2H9T7U3_9ZZZZ
MNRSNALREEDVFTEASEPDPQEEDKPKKRQRRKRKVDLSQSPIKDIQGITPGLWPNNPLHRIGSYYLNLQTVHLQEGEIGKFSNLPEYWVFERLDVHGLNPPDQDMELEVLIGGNGNGEPTETVGTFFIPKGKTCSVCRTRQETLTGRYIGSRDIYLKMHRKPAKEGRIVINFSGYLIEPWR